MTYDPTMSEVQRNARALGLRARFVLTPRWAGPWKLLRALDAALWVRPVHHGDGVLIHFGPIIPEGGTDDRQHP